MSPVQEHSYKTFHSKPCAKLGICCQFLTEAGGTVTVKPVSDAEQCVKSATGGFTFTCEPERSLATARAIDGMWTKRGNVTTRNACNVRCHDESYCPAKGACDYVSKVTLDSVRHG